MGAGDLVIALALIALFFVAPLFGRKGHRP